MTAVQRVARVFGLLLVVLALVGLFTPGGMGMPADTGVRAFGLIPVNLLHNLLHFIIGLWGIAASRSFGRARSYCFVTGTIYAALALLALLSPTFLEIMPIGGAGRWLHAGVAALLLWAAFSAVNAVSGHADI